MLLAIGHEGKALPQPVEQPCANQIPGRREFLLRSTALAAGVTLLDLPRSIAGGTDAPPADDPEPRGSHRGLTDTSASPHVAVRSIGLGDVTWTRGFWADRYATCRDVMIPNMWRIMRGTEPSQFYHNFLIAAGLAEGRHRGPPWNDGDFYKWLEAAAAVSAVAKDEELDRRLDEVIRVIGLAQRGDGYLHTPVLIQARNGDARHATAPGSPRLRGLQPGPPDDRRLRPSSGHRQDQPAARSPSRPPISSWRPSGRRRRSLPGAPSAPRITWGSWSSTAPRATPVTGSWRAG